MSRAFARRFEVATTGRDQMLDVTRQVREVVQASGIRDGLVCVFVAHSTAALSVSEYEPGLVQDIRITAERLAAEHADYAHNRLNADDNAHSHLRSLVIGPSVTVPLVDGALTLGTWQRIVLLDFDTHPRTRTLWVQVLGE
ncbi:secondary thiamine-phosphate synthase enzyme YjbQ [Thermomicrobium sp. CFH 73360]|uniref:secondary thiamine-phosphate synthase enzyme YjbQ n=1 Tax=Thermomicrobium sp. CFH 73360 TaxID=2951987 RepID=UPI0020775F0A|nr:secondary thiamine-phosphate synthase enzyme YjbQ [Thermomicrobium sp. CFH 73360]MCM8747434.1 secondary thiamine-phosphate synthase enzyme YjbQ [Thermomicrobium sp. CFH 73360]